ncbi:MAG: molybdopterin-guanine dinucleotide biosynthesis protein B [Oxalobacter formigenes]|nr:molybdopterin-guanine dinucleotide biosynthesis protein B [Oxalobacter formigenes]
MLGIAGWSGSGKTTLIEALLPRLAARGCRVNVIKSSHHDVELEPPGKDSARIRAAGAAEVMLFSPYRYMLARELRNERKPDLAELVARMTPADMTLVEGFRTAAMPRLEVFRPGLGRPAMYPEEDSIVAVASDCPQPPDLPRFLDWLDLNEPESLCDWLLSGTSSLR